MPRRNRLVAAVALAVLLSPLRGIAGEITFTADDTDFKNPERGMYLFDSVDLQLCGTGASFSQAKRYRKVVESGLTIAYDRMNLTPQIARDFTAAELQCIRTNLAKLRDYGLKVVVRPFYRGESDPCGDGSRRVDAFCDATKAQAKRHMDQLAPVWEEHSDVIAYFEGGYVGDFGEQHSSEHWDFNPTDDDTCGDIKEYWDYLMPRTPANRFVGQRQPRVQGRVACGQYASPITASTAFDGSNNSRIHLWTDGQLKSKYDGGTYWCVPYDAEKAYFDARSDWSLGTGEMDGIVGTCVEDRCTGHATARRCCTDRRDGCSEADLTACGDFGGCDESWSACEKATGEFARHNYTVIRSYPPGSGRGRQNVDKLIAGGCWDSLAKRLGYRLRLVAAQVPDAAQAGESFMVAFTLVNDGFGRIYNERPVYLVMQKQGAADRVDVRLAVDPRRWDPSGMTPSYNVQETVVVPATLAPGTYDVALWLPDADPENAGLEANPAYSVRFANLTGEPGGFGVWDPKLGYNKMGTTVVGMPR